MGQDVSVSPSVSIDDVMLEITENFRYLVSTITNNLLLNMEVDNLNDKAAAVMVEW